MRHAQVGVADITNVGLDGVMGLSFSNAGVSDLVEGLKSISPIAGQPFHFNIFDRMPNQNNFIGISLSRTADLEMSADASFTFNEVDPKYAQVLSTPRIPLFPGNNGRWSILVDSIHNNGVNIPLRSSVPGAPAHKLVVLMDTGTHTATLPPDIWYALYSQIPGAMFSAHAMKFVIPCQSTPIVSVVIALVVFSVYFPHPGF